MNMIYYGLPNDENIGNGKTVSVVGATIEDYINSGEKREIFSNIVLHGIPYTPLTPNNMFEILEVKDALIIFDEMAAIVHKNHHISESCKKHHVEGIQDKYTTGLCHRLTMMVRQVRKNDVDTRSTAQDFWDVQRQMRDLMQVGILCEKYHEDEDGGVIKCNPSAYPRRKCPDTHRHWILQTQVRNSRIIGTPRFFDPEPYYGFYNTNEIVKGWVSYD